MTTMPKALGVFLIIQSLTALAETAGPERTPPRSGVLAAECVAPYLDENNIQQPGQTTFMASFGANEDAGSISIRTPALTYQQNWTQVGQFKKYVPQTLFTAGWAGGETLTYQATGGSLPAFSTTLVAPFPLIVTAPGNGFVAARNQPLKVMWNPVSQGQVTIKLTRINTPKPTFFYRSPASAGSVAIPVSDLMKFQSGEVRLYLWNETKNNVSDRENTLTVRAATFANSSDGHYFRGKGMLQ